MKTKKLITSLLLMLIAGLMNAQPGDLPINREPGKCYAKCLIANNFSSKFLPIYLGEIDSLDHTDTLVVVIREKALEWKKEYVPDCKPKRRKKCWFWKEIKIPEQRVTYVIADTTKTDYYDYEEIHLKLDTPETSYREWKEVLCHEKVTGNTINQIIATLKRQGYSISDNTNEINSEVKNALTQFQKDYNLPVGNLNYETLDMLGVKY